MQDGGPGLWVSSLLIFLLTVFLEHCLLKLAAGSSSHVV